jgi:hypothetical protein
MSTSGYSEMSTDTREIVGTIDDDGHGGEYVIADITRDGAWVAMDVADAAELSDWQ